MKKLISVLSLGAVCAFGMLGAAGSASAQTLEKGVQSAAVLDVQERLSALGYLKAGITGYYGVHTAEAVRQFQREHNLGVNGMTGPETLAKLEQTVTTKHTVLDQLARIIYSEARGETFEGQVAVGGVVLNRVQSPNFPDSITDVIFQPGQFTAVHDGQYRLTPDASAYRAARAALDGSDPSRGALFYYNPQISSSFWLAAKPQTAVIGGHVFKR